MARKQGEDSLIEIIIFGLFVWFLLQGALTDNIQNVGDKAFEKIGIMDEIERLDSYLKD